MDQKLSNAIENDPNRKHIREIVPDEILHKYLNRPTASPFARDLSKRLQNGERNLLLEAIDLHERFEIAEFIKLDVLKRALNGASNDPEKENSHGGYKEAHLVAKMEEIQFLQRLGRNVLDYNIPHVAIRFAYMALPQLRQDVNPKKAHNTLELLGKTNLIVPFSVEDILAGVELFKLGDNDTSQVYRLLRVAKYVDNFIPSDKLTGKLDPVHEKEISESWTKFTYTAEILKNCHWVQDEITSFGMTSGDLEQDSFSGWIEYNNYKKEPFHKEWNTQHATEGRHAVIISAIGDKGWSRFRDFKESNLAWMSWVINYKLDAHCAKKIGLETSMIVPIDLAFYP